MKTIVILLFGAVLPLIAQQEPTVSMKIDLVAWGDTISGLSLKSGEKQAVVEALSFRYSEPISYDGPIVMQIHKSGGGDDAHPNAKISDDDREDLMMPLVPKPLTPNAKGEGQPKRGLALELEKRRAKDPTIVALATLPGTSCRRATVLLAPAGSGTYTAYVIDDDPAKLPPGKLRVHNLSPVPIAIRCGGSQNKELDARESCLVTAQNEQLVYELAYKLGDEWKMQENNIIPVCTTEQVQMMVLKSDNSFFLSTDGSPGGFLQIVTLRRPSF